MLYLGLGVFATSELDKVFSGYQARLIAREDFIKCYILLIQDMPS
jgi:hypothetical protein